MIFAQKVYKKFNELFSEEPYLFRSPGRINFIGEHTDYNGGFVLPAAIDKSIYFAFAPRSDKAINIFSLDLNDFFEGSINNIRKSKKNWANYLIGVIDQLKKSGYKLKGFNCVFGGDIPIGAGLSSSAALEAGLAFAYNNIFELGIDKLSLVKLSQRAENEFVGVNCGIMDQYINIFGEEGKVLRIDCSSLEKEFFPFEYENISIVLFNSNVSHSLASSEYNKRKKECEEGVKIINNEFHEVKSLRDVSIDILNKLKNKIKPTIFKRCKYVIEENARVLKACDALNKHDLKTFGKLMYEAHEKLSKDYEVSCKELDFLVDATKDNQNIFGSRMMGGGFGGCTINIIENDMIDFFSKEITEKYKQKFNLDLGIYVTKISGGTSRINLK